MTTTQQGKSDAEKEFAAGFNEDHAAPADMSDDEAFGLTPPAEDGSGDENDGTSTASDGKPPAVAVVVAPDGAAPEGSAAEEAGETPDQEAQEVAGGAGDAGAADDKGEQRLRSWEGRLKAMEADLKAREAALKGGGGEGQGEGEGGAQGEMETQATDEAAEHAADEAGDGDIEGALASLREDFGDEFVSMIVKIATGIAKKEAGKVAGDHVGEMSKTVEQIIADLNNDRARSHFEKIFEAHPDFVDVAKSPEFEAWLESMSPEEQSAAKQTVESGSAKEVVGLLSAFKASKKGADDGADSSGGADDSAVDAAAGVRSGGGGLTLPTKPGRSDDFAQAWNEF